jgi:hypothetical protein
VRILSLLSAWTLALAVLSAQQAPQAQRSVVPRRKVDPRNTYHRIICVVPIVGSGTRDDPRRPAYAPLPVAGKAVSRSGIIGFSALESDDKKFALVEFVAADPAVFRPILADKAVIAFEKGKASAARASVEPQLQKFKKNFTLDQLQVMVP